MKQRFRDGDGVWADTGTKAAVPADVTTTKIAQGWVAGSNADRPSIEYLNFLQNRVEEKIDDIIEEGPGSVYPRSTDHAKGITTGIWDEGWGITHETENIISGNGTDSWTGIKTYFNAALEPRIVIMNRATFKFEVWDPRTLASIIISDSIRNDLPTGSGQTYLPDSFCLETDSSGDTHVYAVCVDTNAAPDTWQIQAWTINESDSDWSVKSGWGTTGTALSGTGNNAVTSSRDSNIIIADADYVAVACGWVTVNAAGDAGIQLFEKSDGSAVRDGCGDYSTVSANGNVLDGLCSDGTNLFFIVHKSSATSTNQSVLASATIADLTAGSGGTGYPYNLPTGAGNVFGRGLYAIGQGASTVIACISENTSMAAGSPLLELHMPNYAGLMTIEVGDLASGESGTQYIGSEFLDVKFDGLNLWIMTNATDGTRERTRLIKIDSAKLVLSLWNDNPWTLDVTNSIFTVLPTENTPQMGNDNRKYIDMTFDGRDIWVNLEPVASATYSGKLYRLPMALIRH